MLTTECKSLEEVAKLPGIKVQDGKMFWHFSPIPNWYVITGTNCPRCGTDVAWEWEGKLPGITNPASIAASHVQPKVVCGCEILDWGHRWIELKCLGCQTLIQAENFD